MDIILSKFYKFIVESVPNMVVKIPNQAKLTETLDSRRNGDAYVAATLGTDSLYAYSGLDEGAMLEAGYTAQEIKGYRKDGCDPSSLADDNKKRVYLKLRRKKYIDNYTEMNDYYRMLRGLPNYDDDEEIWFDDFDLYDKYDIEPCPVHEISQTILIAMESRGELDQIRKDHPDAKYLYYLGARRVDFFTSRRGEPFELLYFPNTADCYSFHRDFVTMYEECREYFLTVIYNQYFMSKYDQYDGYIGFMILTMAINRIITANFKAFIDRDFYDALSTATFLNAYGIYYDDRFTLSQTKLIAKNLNILLMNKSTDVAMLDVLDLLGFHDYTLMKYYLVKNHRIDLGTNKPEFHYKTKVLEDGSRVITDELDKTSMYNFKFVKVPVGTQNVQESLDNMENTMNYQMVTEDDPYWIEDAELKEKLSSMTFNYIDTKYMDLTIVYRMYAIMFEIQYFTRLILDRKDETKNILISMAKLSTTDMPIFDIMVALICLTCKFYKFTPVILKSPDKILRLLGFNFDADIEAIRKEIEENPEIYDQELLTYLKNPILTKNADINELYGNIKKFDRALIKCMNNARTVKTYKAYRKLYDTLMYVNLNPDLYSYRDGTVPDTYLDYLERANPDLFKIINTIEGEDACSEYINYITTRLTTVFTTTKYLKYIQIVDDSLINSILKVLCFFKSYTVQMKGAGIILLFDSRVYNMAHFYHDFKMGTSHLDIKDVISDGDARYWDMVEKVSETIDFADERATYDDIMKAMSDMSHRINLYTKIKHYMDDVTVTVKDKTSLGMLFEVPCCGVGNMEFVPTEANIDILVKNYSQLDCFTDVESLEKLTGGTNDMVIKKLVYTNVSKMLDSATVFMNTKLDTKKEKMYFMSKVLCKMMVTVPSRLFASNNLIIRDISTINVSMDKYFNLYEETMDSVHLSNGIEKTISSMIRKICTNVNDSFKIDTVELQHIQKCYIESVVSILSKYNLPSIDISTADEAYYSISEFLHRHVIDITESLTTEGTVTLKQSTSISIKDDYIKFIW